MPTPETKHKYQQVLSSLQKCLLTVLLLISATPLFAQCPAKCPSVLLLMIDTLRADKLGTYGFPAATSPEIDALAKSGAVFENVISQASWTRSSIGSILTSRYPREIGILREKWDRLSEAEETLAETLKSNGYYTIGLTANPQLNRSFGFDQGFDRYIDSTVVFRWMKPEPGKAVVQEDVPPPNAKEMLARALEEIRTANSRPIYLQLLLMDVHAHHRITENQISPDLSKYADAAYLQSIRDTSKHIGPFISSLRKILGEDLLIILTSDHGEGLSDHPDVRNSTRHGNLLYTSQINVPLIITGGSKGSIKPGRVKSLVQSLDIFPTILDTLHIPLTPKLQGTSRAAALSNPNYAFTNNALAYSETHWRKGVEKIAVTDGKWLFIDNRDAWKGVNEHELQTFRGAQNGVKTDSASKNQALTSQLNDQLRAWRSRVPGKSSKQEKHENAKPSPAEIEQLKSLGYL